MKTSFKALSLIYFILLLFLTIPLYSWAEEETFTLAKDIQIIDNPYRFGPVYESSMADRYMIINVSIEDIRERLIKGKPVYFVEKQEKAKRTIKAEWITDGLKKEYGVEKIDIRNAIITKDLDFRIMDNLVDIDESGMEIDDIKKQKNRGVEKVFIISSSIYIGNCELQGNFNAGYDHRLKYLVVFKKSVGLFNSKVKKVDFTLARLNGEAVFSNNQFNGQARFRRANFKNDADFRRTSFNGQVDFNQAYFDAKAFFVSASFNSKVDLTSALFKAGGSFNEAIFLNGIDMSDDSLRGFCSILGNAIISNLDLSRFDLSGIDMSKLILINANMNLSKFQPKEVGINILLGARGLSSIKFNRFDKIVELRNEAREAGFRNQARQLTAALRKKRFNSESFSEQFFENIFINLPTDYGANPFRSLKIFGVCILVFLIPYIIALGTQGRDGIWKVWVVERVRKDLGQKKPQLIKLRGLPVVMYGFYFSVLSAFHIGWRDLNVGSWIARIQPREYTLKASGWVRVVSGIQSLISIYLLVIWFLSYFGKLVE